MNFSRRMIVMGSALTLAGAVLATGGTSADRANRTVADAAAGPAIAAGNVAALLSSRPAVLQASANETFVAVAVATSTATAARYAAFERTYAGVPVVGGDFVVVTDATGQVAYISVA